MRTTTLLGTIAGTVLLASIVVFSPHGLKGLFNPLALVITLGGTLAAGIVSFSRRALGPTLEALALVLWRGRQSMQRLAEVLVTAARLVRDQGPAALELDKTGAADPFLRLGLQLVADGTEPARVEEVMRLESDALARRRALAERVFRALASYAPMFGLIGTIVGLIRMLRNLSDPAQIGSGMAVALVTTLYGVLAAGLIFLPFASKTRELHAEETVREEMILTGIRAIQAGENPQLLREKLETFTRKGERA